jgi:hypothetical protein
MKISEDENNVTVGKKENLFPKSYYGLIYRVTQTRIFEMFSPQGGRDHNFKNGKWK